MEGTPLCGGNRPGVNRADGVSVGRDVGFQHFYLSRAESQMNLTWWKQGEILCSHHRFVPRHKDIAIIPPGYDFVSWKQQGRRCGRVDGAMFSVNELAAQGSGGVCC